MIKNIIIFFIILLKCDVVSKLLKDAPSLPGNLNIYAPGRIPLIAQFT